METIPEFRAVSGDSKFIPLSEAELAEPVDPTLLEILTQDAIAKGLKPAQYRVLDFGCGRGATVGKLRRRGWDAYGVDIDPRFVASGAIVIAVAGDASSALSVLDTNGRTTFKDSHFEAVISDQTLEHVEDLDSAAREIGRLLNAGGITFHHFPAPRRFIECHCHLPFVHWLPKSRIRLFAIWALMALGFSGQIRSTAPLRSRSRIVHKYLCEHTYYRGSSEVTNVFLKAGIKLDFQMYARSRASMRFLRYGVPPRVVAMIVAIPAVTWYFTKFKDCMPIGCKL
jgi:SAM-dependent methyltransferase